MQTDIGTVRYQQLRLSGPGFWGGFKLYENRALEARRWRVGASGGPAPNIIGDCCKETAAQACELDEDAVVSLRPAVGPRRRRFEGTSV